MQTEIDELAQVTLAIETVLSELQIRHFFTGGIVVSYYSEPRFTQDVDIVIRLSREELEKLVARLDKDFFVNPNYILAEYPTGKIFQVIHKDTAIKIDFHVVINTPDELKRIVYKEVYQNLLIPIPSRPDAILSKLAWIKKGSHKSRQDVRMMFRFAGEEEKQEARERARQKGLEELLDEVLTAEID